MRAILTDDLGFGDAGKGTTVDWLVQKYGARMVVRYCGGAQAAHNVVCPDGKHHTFAQFGSGTFHGAKTYLSRFVLVTPDSFLMEAAKLSVHLDVSGLVIVHEACPITTPFHRAANQIKEIIRSGGRHGSCGMGIGETAADVAKLGEEMLYARDLLNPVGLARKLRFLRSNKLLELEEAFQVSELVKRDATLAKAFRIFDDRNVVSEIASVYKIFTEQVTFDDGSLLNFDHPVIFEGAQGVLLDEDYGFFPYVTRSKTTLANADVLLKEHGVTDAYRLGIVRAYAVRHGPGPFVTEDEELRAKIVEKHNVTNNWQGKFRAGYFDAVATRYASALSQVDGLALTCLDQVQDIPLKVAVAYEDIAEPYYANGDLRINNPPDLSYLASLSSALLHAQPRYVEVANIREAVAEYLRKPVVVTSSGVTRLDKEGSL